MPAAIRTNRMISVMRQRIVDTDRRRVLVARMEGSKQAPDLTLPPNAHGIGRRRHFRRAAAQGWPDNPLPIVPASRWLGMAPPDVMQAQVFQLAGCAWRCWYCFVPFDLLSADISKSEWVDASTLVDLYLDQADRPPVLDLSGGSPDLAPEWIAWTMDAIERRGAQSDVYLWSDDNLSTDWLLSKDFRSLLSRIEDYGRGYGKACCLKGFDEESFAFNTAAQASGFGEQLRILRGYSETGIDLHLYVTLTALPRAGHRGRVRKFVEQLAAIREDLPMRTVPLLVTEFSTMTGRLDPMRTLSLEYQWSVLDMWREAVEALGLAKCE